MRVATLRVRYDRKTGAELDRQILDPCEMPEEEYAALLVRAITGMSPEAVARDFLKWYDKKGEQSA